jgi:uncharacterized membrane protein
MKEFTKTQKLTISAVCMGLYLMVMLCTQSFAFGQYQIRIATALYGLSAIFPFLILPFGFVNMASNLIMGGLGPLDMIGGGLMGLLTTSAIVLGKRLGFSNWIVAVAITFIPRSVCTHLAVPAFTHSVFGISFYSDCWAGHCRCCRHAPRNSFGTLRYQNLYFCKEIISERGKILW